MDILMDVIGGVESARLSTNKRHHHRGMSEDHDRCSQCWFSVHFRQVFFNTNALPRINISADVWGESSIMTGVY